LKSDGVLQEYSVEPTSITISSIPSILLRFPKTEGLPTIASTRLGLQEMMKVLPTLNQQLEMKFGSARTGRIQLKYQVYIGKERGIGGTHEPNGRIAHSKEFRIPRYSVPQ
jgi:hypothetical protein